MMQEFSVCRVTLVEPQQKIVRLRKTCDNRRKIEGLAVNIVVKLLLELCCKPWSLGKVILHISYDFENGSQIILFLQRQ